MWIRAKTTKEKILEKLFNGEVRIYEDGSMTVRRATDGLQYEIIYYNSKNRRKKIYNDSN